MRRFATLNCARTHATDAVLEKGVELLFMNRGSSAPVLASVCAMKLAACRCTRRYSVVWSERWCS